MLVSCFAHTVFPFSTCNAVNVLIIVDTTHCLTYGALVTYSIIHCIRNFNMSMQTTNWYVDKYLSKMGLFCQSILAEEFLTNHKVYEQEAKKHTEKTAGESLADLEKVNELWDHESLIKNECKGTA